MDKKIAKAVFADVQEALQAVATKHGLDVGKTTGRFGATELRINITLNEKSESTGKLFTFRGTNYSFVRYERRRYKYPIIAKRIADGKTYCLPFSAVPAEILNAR